MSSVDKIREPQRPTPEPITRNVVAPTRDGNKAIRVPEHIQGKDLATIQRDYASLESELGRLRNEVGELRKAKPPAEPPKPPPDFDTDPSGAVQAAIDPVRSEVARLRDEQFSRALEETHPGHAEIVASPEFAAWAKERKSRRALVTLAQHYDIDAARELLDEYRAAGGPTADEAVRRDRMARAGLSERASGRRPAPMTYSRAQVRHMRINHPAEYQAQREEIERAYREGRVR